MKFKYVVLTAMMLPMMVLAQEGVGFTADRPGASTGPDVLPLHRVQWETGVGFSRTFDSEAFTLNNTLLRYGLTNFAELRLGFDILNLRQRHTEDSKYGVSALTIGSKIKMLEGAGLMPSVSALIEMACPHIGSRDFVPDHLAPSLYLLVNHDVADWLGIGYSAGAEWGGSDPAPAAFWALTLSFAPVDKLGLFVESYNRYYQTKDPLLNSKGDYSVDFGVTYMVHPKVQLDVAADLNLQQPDKYYAVSAGVAWQIN